LRPKTTTSDKPLFPIALSLQPEAELLKVGWKITSMDADRGASPWEVYFAFLRTPQNLGGRVQYDPAAHDRGAIVEMILSLERLMESIVANPARSVSSLDFVPCNAGGRREFEPDKRN